MNKPYILSPLSPRQQEVTPENGKDFKLAQLYKLLDCELIQVLELGSGLIMIIDEEGKLNSSVPNEAATIVAREARCIDPSDYIVGKALICRSKELK